MKKYLTLSTVLFFLMMWTSLIGQSFAASQSTNYKMTNEVLESGGGTASSSSYKITGKAREREIDSPVSSAYKMLAGFLRGAYLRIVDPTPPAAITTLSAQTGVNPGEVILSWTAVGDDGTTGTAASYILKYSATQILTQAQFGAAATYVQSWLPIPAGGKETKTLTGLREGDYLYFSIKAVDDVGNIGGLGYSAAAVVKSSDSQPIKVVTEIENYQESDGGKVFTQPGVSSYVFKYVLNKGVGSIIGQGVGAAAVVSEIQFYIFNNAGELVWKKVAPGNQGLNEVAWNGITDYRNVAANGVYVYHVIAKVDGQIISLGKGKFIVHR